MADNLKRGDFVSWNSSGGAARGRVDLIVRNGEVPGIDGDVTITGTEDDPAARIVVYRRDGDGWSATDTKVGHKWTALTKIDPLPEPSETDDDTEAFLDTQAPDADELDKVFAEYQSLTNMGAAELRRWKDNPCSSAAGVDKPPIDRNIELKSTKKEDWTEKHIRWANRTISFVSRMLGNESGEPASKDCPDSKRNYSLKNWARDVHKGKSNSYVPDSVSTFVDRNDLGVELTRVFQAQITPMGKPAPEQLRLMNQYRPMGAPEYTTDNMVSVPLMASNNLLMWSSSRWAIAALEQMAETYPGKPMLLDHADYSVKESVGFVYDSQIIHSNAVPEEIIDGAGESEYNEIIVKSEGFYQLVAYAAIAANHPIIDALAYGRVGSVSTGCITNGTYRCPLDGTEFNMSKLKCEHGHYHPIARYWMRLDEDDIVAPYDIKDGVISSYELSFVNMGNLPAASIPKAG